MLKWQVIQLEKTQEEVKMELHYEPSGHDFDATKDFLKLVRLVVNSIFHKERKKNIKIYFAKLIKC